jgi:hypothetical protein
MNSQLEIGLRAKMREAARSSAQWFTKNGENRSTSVWSAVK